MKSFAKDNEWQKDIRDNILSPFFYEQEFFGRYVFIDSENGVGLKLQKSGIDTIAYKDGKTIFIEEKIVRWPENNIAHSRFAFETHNASGSPSWMEYGRSDKMLYCFCQQDGGVLCYYFNFLPVKEWFAKFKDKYSDFTGDAKTAGKLIPIKCISDLPETSLKIVYIGRDMLCIG